MTVYYSPLGGQGYGWMKAGAPTDPPKIATFKKTEESKKRRRKKTETTKKKTK